MNYTQSQPNININPLIMGIMNENNALTLEILNHLIYLSTRFRSVFISQSTLAAKFGVTRQWINTLLSRWKSLGVIKYRQQDFNRSCIYFLHPLLNQEKNRIKFKLPAAALLLSISSLCSAVFQGELTLSNNKNLFINNQSINQSIIQSIFLKNQTIPSDRPFSEDIIRRDSFEVYASEMTMTKKEGKVMNAVIKVLSDAYGMTTAEEELLSQFSEEILQKSFTRLQETKEKKDIPSPVKYFIAIATNLNKEAQRFPKTGRTGGFKQIGSFVKVPAYVPDKRFNLTDAERISSLSSEISNLEEIIANPQNHFIKKVNLSDTLPNFENVLKHLKEELDELVNPKVEQTKEIDENDMTPEQWLIWNRNRKIQRLKEKHG